MIHEKEPITHHLLFEWKLKQTFIKKKKKKLVLRIISKTFTHFKKQPLNIKRQTKKQKQSIITLAKVSSCSKTWTSEVFMFGSLDKREDILFITSWKLPYSFSKADQDSNTLSTFWDRSSELVRILPQRLWNTSSCCWMFGWSSK